MLFIKQPAIAMYRKLCKPDYCPILNMPLLEKDAVLDHDHVNGCIRDVIHRDANQFEGRVLNLFKRYVRSRTDLTLPQVLRNLADYLEFHTDMPSMLRHPQHAGTVKKQLLAKPAAEQKELLAEFDIPGNTQAVRKKNMRKYITKKYVHIGPDQVAELLNNAHPKEKR